MSPAALPHRVIYWYVYKWRSISFEERVKHLIFEGLLAVSDWKVEVIPKLKILLYACPRDPSQLFESDSIVSLTSLAKPDKCCL